jgi:hypothetical protein
VGGGAFVSGKIAAEVCALRLADRNGNLDTVK